MPEFLPDVTAYAAGLGLAAETITVTPTAVSADAVITVNDLEVASGDASAPIALALGESSIRVVVTAGEATRTYDLAADRGGGLAQRAYTKASNIGNDDGFGEYLAIDGDTIAISARGEDSDGPAVNEGASDSGAVYVFVRDGATWRQQAFIKAGNAGASDSFGASVALSVDTLAVGAHLEDGGGAGIDPPSNENTPGAGAVYVFVRNNGAWSQQAYLKASNPGGSDLFGATLALQGDTLVVGARVEDSDSTNTTGATGNDLLQDSGAVYVFGRSGTSWTQQAFLKATNADAGDQFGFALALAGDTLAVSAGGERGAGKGVNPDSSSNTAPNAGAVYVFVRNGATWTHQAYLKATNTEAGDQFGFSIALDRDTLVVGAIAEDGGATGVDGDEDDNANTSAGAAYVFVRSGTSWSRQAYIKASNTNTGDQFGASIAIVGDVLAIGADGEDGNAIDLDGDETNNTAMNAGAVYLFYRREGAWEQVRYIKASNTGANDFFHRVASSSGVIVVGARLEDSADANNTADEGAPNSGAIYVFE